MRCLAAGFPDKIMRRMRGGYETATGNKVRIHPGSALYGQRPRLVVAAEIVVSSRTYARQVSALQPDWLAEVRPDLAASWNLSGAGRRARKGLDVAEMPRAIEVGGVQLKVRRRNGRPTINVPVGVVDRLADATADDIDPVWLKWPARVVTPHGVFASGTRFGRLLALLPVMPLPRGSEAPAADIPEGALLTVADNWSTLEWLLKERLLVPAMPMVGKRPGWGALVANGLGTYWFEVMRSFPAAVQTSSVSLQELLDGLPEAHDAREWLPDQLEALQTLDRLVEAVRRR